MKSSSPRNLSRRVYVYRLDAEGRWSYGRNPMDDPALARQFFRDIRQESPGRYVVECEGELCQVRVAEAPSFVDEIEIVGRPGAIENVEILLASGARETLDPSTLRTGRGGALYCTDSRGLASKFRRRPHLELASRIEHEGKDYFLTIAGKRYRVPNES